MLKKTLLCTAIAAVCGLGTAGISGNAHAGYGHHYKHHYNHRGHHGHRHYRYRHHRHSHRGAYLLGGIALGALISHAYHAPYHRRHTHHDGYAVREVYRQPVVAEQPGRIIRSLYRDRDGNCFERKREGGDELLIELPAQECAW